MMLLILEGRNTEPPVVATIRQLYFADNQDQLVCSYGTDTYTLWKEVKSYVDDGCEPDVFEILRERLHKCGDSSLDGYSSYQFESIYLFFDYDPQNRTISSETLNSAISDMLDLFSDPMDKGQLFISYPMIEALYCINSLSSKDFLKTTVSIADCRCFKSWSNKFEYNRKRYMLLFKTDKSGNITEQEKQRMSNLKSTWDNLVKMHASKAHYISKDSATLPTHVDDVTQKKIFNGQLSKFIPLGTVSILSSFTMFLFEYFHGGKDF